jgi:ATP phosphoribosyltransferase
MENKQKNKIGQSEAINHFIDRLIQEKALENIDAETMEQIRKDLADRIEDRINASILAKMPTEKLEEFDKILDSNDEEKIQSFCQANIPELNELIAGELMNFRNIYLNS